MMRLYFFKILLVILLAVGCAVYIKQMPALMIIEYGDYTFAGSLWLFLLVLVAMCFVLYVGWRFLLGVLHLPGGLKLFFFGSRASKIDRHLKGFLLAFMGQNQEESRKHSLALSKLHFHRGIFALTSALSAAKVGKTLECLDGIELAKQDTKLSPWILHFAELQLAVLRQEPASKIETLITDLKKESEAERFIWPFELKYAESIHHWKRVSNAAYRLKTLKCMDSATLKSTILTCDAGELMQASSVEVLKALWNEHSRGRRKEPILVAAMAERLIAFRQYEAAAALLEERLNHSWSELLFEVYALLPAHSALKQLDALEKWLPRMPQNAHHFLLLAKIYAAHHIFSRAEQYYEKSLLLDPSVDAHQALSDFFAAKGQFEAAFRHTKMALKLKG